MSRIVCQCGPECFRTYCTLCHCIDTDCGCPDEPATELVKYVTFCPACGLHSRDLDEYGYTPGSMSDIVREFWMQHTSQACELHKALDESRKDKDERDND